MAKANCNWWLYSKYIYNIGRTSRHAPYSELELEAVKTFITSILETRPAIKPRVNLKIWNSEKSLTNQNFLALGSMLQVIGRNLKQDPPTEEEKELCDALIEATGERKNKIVLPYVSITATVDPEESGIVSGTGAYAAGTSVEITAVPAEGYVFSKWEDDSTEATRTIELGEEDVAVTATFIEG